MARIIFVAIVALLGGIRIVLYVRRERTGHAGTAPGTLPLRYHLAQRDIAAPVASALLQSPALQDRHGTAWNLVSVPDLRETIHGVENPRIAPGVDGQTPADVGQRGNGEVLRAIPHVEHDVQ